MSADKTRAHYEAMAVEAAAGEPVKVDVLKMIRMSSAVIGNLPELPGYNGSILTIDDTEAQRIERDLDICAPVIEKLIEALTWAVNNPSDDAYWIQQARSALARAGSTP